MLTPPPRVIVAVAALVLMSVTDSALAQSHPRPPRRLLAAWQLVEPEGMGPTYYFYRDGVLVMQNPRRREFVVLARWRMEAPNVVTLSNYRPRNTTLARAELAALRKATDRWRITSLGAQRMSWTSVASPERFNRFRHRGELPDRTENIYWGLGTKESYARGIRKQIREH